MYILLYYSIGVVLLLALIRQCQWQPAVEPGRQSVGSNGLFLGVVMLTLVVMRVPSLCFNEELNVDESQVIASGITLLEDPIYGRSVDGTTIGPLNSYALLLPHVLGLPMDYSSARLLTLVLIVSSVLLFYQSLLLLVSPVANRISTVFITLLFAWTANDSFLHFSSELTSVWLLNAGFYLTLRVIQRRRPSTGLLFSIGLLSGLAPYGKLQALPIFGMLLLVLSLYLVRTYRAKAPAYLMAGSLGFLLPTALVFSVAYAYDVSDYFINFYFISSLLTYRQLYADVPLVHRDFLIKLLSFPHFAWHHTDFFVFVLLPFFIGGGSVWALSPRGHRLHRFVRSVSWPAALIGLITVAAGWAVIMPGTEFGHHLLLLVFPVGWATGLWLDRLLNGQFSALSPGRLATVLLAFCAGALLLSNTIIKAGVDRLLARTFPAMAIAAPVGPALDPAGWLYQANPSLFSFPTRTRLAVSPVARIVRQYASPTDRLAVWGWHCSYYVETQLAQGVSEAHTQRSVLPNPMQAMYLRRYARELAENRPLVFLDAVGRNSLTLVRPNQRSEHFRAVQAIVHDRYHCVGNVDDVRIYLRNDYVAYHSRPAPVRTTARQPAWQSLLRPAVVAAHKKPPTRLSGLGAVDPLNPD